MDRGLVDTRQQAASLIAAGRVLVAGTVADKPARLVAPAEPIELAGGPPRFVGRGGEKLDAALTRFAIDVRGRRALDAGASTGGFTDCLLQAGASEVLAVDVGHGQLHERLRSDPRVVNLERVDIRDMAPDTVGGAPVGVVTAALSFISVVRAVPVLVGWAAVTDSLSWTPVVMFAIIFVWTPPHFWALAVKYKDDYQAASVPMLPAVATFRRTAREILVYSVILVGVSLLLAAVAKLGVLYVVGASVLGAVFIVMAVRLWRRATPKAAMQLFSYSITYLTLLFVVMAVDIFVKH